MYATRACGAGVARRDAIVVTVKVRPGREAARDLGLDVGDTRRPVGERRLVGVVKRRAGTEESVVWSGQNLLS